MRVIFMGKDKESVVDALTYLINSGVEVVAVVAPSCSEVGFGRWGLGDVAKSFQLPVCSDTELYQCLAGTGGTKLDLSNIDFVISFLFWKRIKKPLIDLARRGCINFHSAPLPKYRGWGGYNAAILNNETQWGVSAHFVDEEFDTGDIIKVDRFDIDPKKETALSLEGRSQEVLLALFTEVIGMALHGNLPREHQERSSGTTYTKQKVLGSEIVNFSDSADVINAKIRAFWYPPFAAKITLEGNEYFLITPEIMEEITKKYCRSDDETVIM